MTSNIINFLDIKRAKESEVETSALEVDSQMPLPFDGKSTLLFVFSNDFGYQDDFLNFCSAEFPDFLIDMRLAPRLDFVRPQRTQAFELFKLHDLEYRDMLGRLGVSSYDMDQETFAGVLEAIGALDAVHDPRRPILVLFDNAIFAQSCVARLHKGFQVALLDADTIRNAAVKGAQQRM